MSSRRSFLKTASCLGLGLWAASCAGQGSTAAAAERKRFGLQVYALGRELESDLPAMLPQIREWGYSSLEIAGYRDGKIGMFGEPIDMMEYKRMAADAGLGISSSHVRPPLREYTADNHQQLMDFWKQTVADHVELGVKYLIQPSLPNCRSVEDVRHVAEVLSEAGRLAREAGIEFGLHNDAGFSMRVAPGGEEAMFNLNGRYPEGTRQLFDVLLEETDPDCVTFEFDCMAAVQGGDDPVDYLRRHPRRFHLLHVRDYAALGQSGMLNYENIFRQFYANGFSDFYVEDENAMSGRQAQRMKESAAWIQAAEFVR